ncbi:hypothetical protein [Psychromonas ossibalaenae]|uniref:hypothetical protein n=1 Tax=Psychromonas ossibalaenae TaxID=444922 RepID=UPI00038228D6|nr:hypothetical protein [Psychromonas ossibalaenae]
MNTFIKQSVILAGITLLSACGGSGGGGDIPAIKINPSKTNTEQPIIKDTQIPVLPADNISFKAGSQKISQDYLPLRLHVNNMRNESIKFTIDNPSENAFALQNASFIFVPAEGLKLQQSWRSGFDHSIQVHKSKADTKFAVKISDNFGDTPWAAEGRIYGVDDTGYIIALPQESDIDGQDPIARVEGLSKEDPTGSYISFINRFSHPNLDSDQSDICLAVIDGETIYPVNKSLAQTEATPLIDTSTLGHSAVKRLAVVTRANLNDQEEKSNLSAEQLQTLEEDCPHHQVLNGETMQLLDIATEDSAMKAVVIHSPAYGEIAKTKTDAQLKSLRWKSETDAVFKLPRKKSEDLELFLKEAK